MSDTSNGITFPKKALRFLGFDVDDLPEDHQVRVLVREDGTGEFDLNVDQLEADQRTTQTEIPRLRG